tara:strand:+ start:587 stop:991 length:405 start_codon:yes stop_codon:yes gene_type:complete
MPFKKIGKVISKGFQDALSGVTDFVLNEVIDDALGADSFASSLRGSSDGPLDATLLTSLLQAARQQGQFGTPRKEKTTASAIEKTPMKTLLGQLPGEVGLSQGSMPGLPELLPMWAMQEEDGKDSVLKRLLDVS